MVATLKSKRPLFTSMNNKGQFTAWIILAGVLALLLIVGGWMAMGYNNFITQDTEVDNQWANVQTQYQRRADLIPNLVSTVEAVVDFEQGTQTQIAALRSGAAAAKTAIDSASTPAELQAAGTQLDNVVGQYRGLNINVENYPQLRGVESFTSLQDELSGTENRIQVARERYNEAVKNFNLAVRRFPSNLLAGLFGFDQREFFEADSGSENAPDVGDLFNN